MQNAFGFLSDSKSKRAENGAYLEVEEQLLDERGQSHGD